MGQVWKVRLPGGQTLIPGDWTSAEPLYSTVEVAAGVSLPLLTAFSYGRGAQVPGSIGPRNSNLSDTNLEGEGARLPENEELVIYNMCIEMFKIGQTTNSNLGSDPIPATDAPDVPLLDVLRMQQYMIVVLRIASVKEYTRQPISYYGASTGTEMYTSGATTLASAGASGFFAGNNGGTSVYDARLFASPLYVAGGETLAVDFKAGPGSIPGLDLNPDTGRIRLRTYLDGYRRRPVA